jgi:6-pyruvoyltetrahydropterin/6-carboxytetrahydropterin synthase
MFRIYKEFTIDSAHVVIGHTGKCGREHGHTYRFEVFLMGKDNTLNGIGILVDFGDIKEIISGKYDHRRLNDFPEFDVNQGGVNPTAEGISMVVGKQLTKVLPKGIYLEKIRVWETPTAYAEWSEHWVMGKTL